MEEMYYYENIYYTKDKMLRLPVEYQRLIIKRGIKYSPSDLIKVNRRINL